MKQNPSEDRNDLALLAIQRVLEAERSSEAALQACRQHADDGGPDVFLHIIAVERAGIRDMC